MADSILSEYTSLTLADVREEVGRLYRMLSPADPDSKKCMSLILVYVMATREVGGVTEWADATTSLLIGSRSFLKIHLFSPVSGHEKSGQRCVILVRFTVCGLHRGGHRRRTGGRADLPPRLPPVQVQKAF